MQAVDTLRPLSAQHTRQGSGGGDVSSGQRLAGTSRTGKGAATGADMEGAAVLVALQPLADALSSLLACLDSEEV